MDSLTHLVLGAAIGEAVLGKRIGKRAMLWGAFANTVPDLDVFVSPFFSHTEGLLVHRGITHSLLFALVASPMLGKLFARFNFKHQASWQSWSWLFFLGIITHIFVDVTTAYGTGLLEPFSPMRFSINTMFVADPLYTLPLIISCIALMVLKRDSPARRKWNRFGLYLSCLYLVFTFVNKAVVHNVFRQSLEKQGITYSRFITTPTPLNNILWMGMAEDRTGFHIAYYSLLDKSSDLSFYHVDKNDSLLDAATDEPTRNMLRIFSNGYYCMRYSDTLTTFNDLRFGQLGGWEDPSAPYAFSYELNRNDPPRPLDRSRGIKGSIGDAFRSLMKRMRGI